MKDAISIVRVNLLHPKVIKLFTDFITDAENDLNITLRVTQGLRTIDEQNALYAQGRTTPGNIVTNAKGGSSFHNYGVAIDVVRMIDGQPDWHFDNRKLVPYSDKLGLEWGGRWRTIKDEPHFQNTFGLTWRQMLVKYNARDFIAGTKFINIP